MLQSLISSQVFLHFQNFGKEKRAGMASVDPTQLSVRQLRNLLTALRIDHSHCVEKNELIALLPQQSPAKAPLPPMTTPTVEATQAPIPTLEEAAAASSRVGVPVIVSDSEHRLPVGVRPAVGGSTSPNSGLELKVRGKYFSVDRDAIARQGPSLLSDLVAQSGQNSQHEAPVSTSCERDNSGVFLLDRSSGLFSLLNTFLQNNELPARNDHFTMEQMRDEASFYRLKTLTEVLDTLLNSRDVAGDPSAEHKEGPTPDPALWYDRAEAPSHALTALRNDKADAFSWFQRECGDRASLLIPSDRLLDSGFPRVDSMRVLAAQGLLQEPVASMLAVLLTFGCSLARVANCYGLDPLAGIDFDSASDPEKKRALELLASLLSSGAALSIEDVDSVFETLRAQGADFDAHSSRLLAAACPFPDLVATVIRHGADPNSAIPDPWVSRNKLVSAITHRSLSTVLPVPYRPIEQLADAAKAMAPLCWAVLDEDVELAFALTTFSATRTDVRFIGPLSITAATSPGHSRTSKSSELTGDVKAMVGPLRKLSRESGRLIDVVAKAGPIIQAVLQCSNTSFQSQALFEVCASLTNEFLDAIRPPPLIA